jgi:site-specific recombinase XerD
MSWLTVPLREVTRKEIGVYVDHLLQRGRRPKTIMCHLQTIRLFFDYLTDEEGIAMVNPVTRISKKKALAKIAPLHGKLKRYQPDDPLLNFLRGL